MANRGRKITVGLELAARISNLVYELRVVYAKMSSKQQGLFTRLAQGYNELETFLLSKNMKEISGVIPVVTTNTGQIVKTTSLRTLDDLKKLEPSSLAALEKIAGDHIKANLGENVDYRRIQEDINLYFKLVAPQAAQTVIDIMTDPKVSAQTRLTAANSVLNRAGHSPKGSNEQAELPRVVIEMPPVPQIQPTQPPEGEVIEGQTST